MITMEAKLMVVLVLTASTYAGPLNVYRNDNNIDATACSRSCKGSPTNFNYEPDTTYIYDYQVKTSTAMTGASEDEGVLSISAQARIEKLSDCEFALVMRDVHVMHSDPSTKQLKTSQREDEFSQAVTHNVLRFGFDDGHISSVCPESDEPKWVLNFKRGLVSALQNNGQDRHTIETDVSGECKTQYVSANAGMWARSTLITKTKDMRSCSARDNLKSILQTVHYKVPSEIQSIPVLNSTHTCEQTINSDKIMSNVQCHETHLYVPFSNKQSGGATKILQTLTLKQSKKGTDTAKKAISERRSLVFEHDSGLFDEESSRELAEQKLKEICDQTRDGIRPETPRLFSDLVSIVKKLDKSDLEDIYRKLERERLCPKNNQAKKFFLDALPMAGSTGSVQFMTQLIVDQSTAIDSFTRKTWLASLSFVRDPTEQMITETVKLIKSSLVSDTLLPVTTLANTFCLKHEDCSSNYEVQRLADELDNAVDYSCKKSPDQIIPVLRGIGNLGNVRKLMGSLSRCLTSYASSEVKVAAAEAYRRMPCETDFNKEDSQLWTILKERNSDFELRIHTYLALMRCPTLERMQQMAALLTDDMDQNVGSFIYSHLRNLAESSNPHKQDTARSAQKLSLNKAFDLSSLKASHNYEASFLINRLNLGLTAESNIILNPSVPVPRSAKANLTIELFGRSVNLLEIGGRVENLETVVNKLLEADSKSKDYNLDEVKGSLYGRVFGNEVVYHRVDNLKTLMKSLKDYGNILDLLIKLNEDQEYNYSYSRTLFDFAYVIPTIAGLPLNISINSSATFDFSISGKADLRKLSTTPRSLDIDGQIRPSAAVEVSGSMAVDAKVTRAGLRMRNTLHTSTQLKGRINLKRGRELDFELEPPADKMEIFGAKSQFFVVHNEIEKEQKMINDDVRQLRYCSSPSFVQVSGVEICGELVYPNATQHADAPYFPLTGPSSISLTLNKKDSHSAYKIFAKRLESKKRTEAQILINTPGSRTDRLISTDLKFVIRPHPSFELVHVSPWKKVNMQAQLIGNYDMYNLHSHVTLDNDKTYKLNAEVTGLVKNIIRPLVEISSPERTIALVSGEIQTGNKKSADIEIRDLNNHPYNIKGEMITTKKENRIGMRLSNQGKNEYIVNVGSFYDRSGKDGMNLRVKPELVVKTPKSTLVSIRGSADIKPEKSFTCELIVDLYKMKPTTLAFSRKLVKNKKGVNTRHQSTLKIKSPVIVISGNEITNFARTNFNSRIKLSHKIPNYSQDVVTLNLKLNDKSKNELSKYILNSNMDFRKNPDYNNGIKLDVTRKQRLVDLNSVLRYGSDPKNKDKTVEVSATLNNNGKCAWKCDLDAKMKVKAPEMKVNMQMDLNHAHSNKQLDSNLALKFKPLLKKDIKGSISLKDKSSDLGKYIGKGSVSYDNTDFSVETDLKQKANNQWTHDITLSSSGAQAHTVQTTYRSIKNNGHELKTEIKIDGLENIVIDLESNITPRNQKLIGKLSHGQDIYSVSSVSKLIPEKAVSWNLDLVCPQRKVEVDAKGNQDKSLYDGSVQLNWNAAEKNDRNSKISMKGSVKHESDANRRSINIDGSIDTPFDLVDQWKASLSLDNNNNQMQSSGKVAWRKEGRKNNLAANFNVKKPLTLSNVQTTLQIQSNVFNKKSIQLSIDHKLASELQTLIKGNVDSDKVELEIAGHYQRNRYTTDISGNLKLSSSFRPIKIVEVKLTHHDDGKSYKTEGSLQHNEKPYGVELNMNNENEYNEIKHKGSLKLLSPRDSVDVEWEHELDKKNHVVDSKIESSWGKRKQVEFNLRGSHSSDSTERVIEGKTTLRTPWPLAKKVTMQMKHTLSHDLSDIHSNGEITVGKNQLDNSFTFILKNQKTMKSVSLELDNISTKSKISAQSEVNFARYPYTCTASVEWAPKKTIDFDGSLNLESYQLMELNSKLTTPYKPVQNIILKASHKTENSECISHINLDYGVRQAIDLETRLKNVPDLQYMHVKLETPFKYVRHLDTGLRLEQERNGMKASADFEMTPLVQKHDFSAEYDFDGIDINGNAQLTTPHVSVPYLGISVKSTKSPDKLRTSYVTVTVSNTKYTIENAYRLVTPYQMDIHLRTPNADFNNLGISLRHECKDYEIKSEATLTYSPKKTVDVNVDLQWKDVVDGSLELKTPFNGYKINSIIFHQEGDILNFKIHGNLKFGRNLKGDGDVQFMHNEKITKGTMTINTPFEKMKTLKGKLIRKGPIDDLSSIVQLECDKIEINAKLNNKMSPTSMESHFALETPFSENQEYILKYNRDAYEKKGEGSIVAKYGDLETNGKIVVEYPNLYNSKLAITLNLPYWKELELNIDNSNTGNDFNGKGTLKVSYRNIGDMQYSYSKTGDLSNMEVQFNVNQNQNVLVDVNFKNTATKVNGLSCEASTKGSLLPILSAKLSAQGTPNKFNAKTNIQNDGGDILISNIDFLSDRSIIDLDGSVSLRYKHQDRSIKVKAHKEGDLNDFKVESSALISGKGFSTDITFKNKDKLEGQAHLKSVHDDSVNVGIEFDHTGGFEKFLSNGKIILSENKAISGKIDFYMYIWKRIEFKSQLITPFKNLESLSAEYRHQADYGMYTCMLDINAAHQFQIGAEVIAQDRPDSKYMVKVKTPLKQYKELLILSERSNNKISNKLKLGSGMNFQLDMTHDPTASPAMRKVQLTTPFKTMQKAVVHTKEHIFGGEVNIQIVFHDKEEYNINAGLACKEGVIFVSNISVSGTPEWIYKIDSISANIEVSQSENKGKKIHFHTRWDGKDKIVFDGTYKADNKKQDLFLQLKTAFKQMPIHEISFTNDCESEQGKAKHVIELTLNSDKVLDVDIEYDMNDKVEFTTTFRNPWPMEYSVSHDRDGPHMDSSVELNWDKASAESQIRIESLWSDKSTKSEEDKFLKIVLHFPESEMGVQHTLRRDQDKTESAGKVFWGSDDKSRVAYSLDVNTNNRRGEIQDDGVFKLELPQRTLGVTGFLRKNQQTKVAEGTFSWDLEKDASKQIGVKATVSHKDSTKADISITLPSDMKLDSELVFNSGDLLLYGKTDISFSSDAYKTLTVFSTVKSQPHNSGSYSFFDSSDPKAFNYSIELGVQQKQTKVDVSIDSHLGNSDKRFTSSLGMKYLTSHKQVMNLALWTEINKLKDKMKVMVISPNKKLKVEGKITSRQPLNMQVSSTVDDKLRMKSSLEVDSNKKELNLNIGNEDKNMNLKVFYPNRSAIVAEISRDNVGDKEVVLGVRLVSPKHLHSSLHWQPGLVREVEDSLVRHIKQIGADSKETLTEIARDTEKELTAKYRSITNFLSNELRPMLQAIDRELSALSSEISDLLAKLEDMKIHNQLYLGNLYRASESMFDFIKDAFRHIRDWYQKTIQIIFEILRDIKKFPFGDQLREILQQRLIAILELVDEIVLSMINAVRQWDQKIKDGVKVITQHPVVLKAGEHINEIPRLPGKVAGMIKENLPNMKPSDIIPSGLKHYGQNIYTKASEVISYLEVQERLENHISQLVNLIIEILEEEFREYIDSFKTLRQNPITVYDPQHGEIQADVALPIALNNLDEVPNAGQYLKEVGDSLYFYVPNLNISQYMSTANIWDSQNKVAKEVQDDIRDVRQSPRIIRPQRFSKGRWKGPHWSNGLF